MKMLHGNIMSLTVFSELVDLHKIRVVQVYDDLCLVDEHANKMQVVRMFWSNLFDDELLLEAGYSERASQINLGHTTRRDSIKQLIFSKWFWEIH